MMIGEVWHMIWNNIPASVCDSGTLGTVKTALKTHLFNSAYTSCYWQPSIGASDLLLRDLWRQPKKYLVDWLIVFAVVHMTSMSVVSGLVHTMTRGPSASLLWCTISQELPPSLRPRLAYYGPWSVLPSCVANHGVCWGSGLNPHFCPQSCHGICAKLMVQLG